jgi:ketosteroid isomerase-like protein
MIETATEAATSTSRSQIEHNLRDIYDAWQARDEAGVRAFFSDRDDVMLWGTDAFERILGRSEADRDFAGWIATCPPWTTMEPTHRVMGLHDGLAWVADEVTGRWARDDEVGMEEFRVTTVWEETDGSWRLVHANIASPH